MNRITERQIIAAANRLPSLGTAVGSILASMEKPTTNIHIIATEIGRDPAQASSIFLTTLTDSLGFFTFLGLAALFLF